MSIRSNIDVSNRRKSSKSTYFHNYHFLTIQSLLAILFLCVIHSSVYSQAKDRAYFTDLSKAMGFYYGTQISLGAIITQYPDLSRIAMKAKLDFEIAHKKAEDQIEAELSKQVKMDKSELRNKIIQQARNQYNLEYVSKAEIEQFLSTFDNDRIKGSHDLYSEYVSILLRHNPLYVSTPIKEFLDGYLELFESDGYSKSLGLNFSIEYPKSWLIKDGKHPHIVKLIKSPNGSCMVTIAVRDLIKESEINIGDLGQEEELDDIINEVVFTPEFGRSLIADIENKSNYSFKKTTLDGQPAAIIRVSGTIHKTIVTMKVHITNYIVTFSGKLIYLTAMLIESPGANLAEVREKYELLGELMINSLIIKDRW